VRVLDEEEKAKRHVAKARRIRALSLLGSVGIDLALGELPSSWHPVGLAGRALAVGTERHRSGPPAGQLVGGAAGLAVTAAAAAGVGLAIEAGLPRGLPAVLGRALALKQLFALRMLLREADGVRRALESDDLDGARLRLGALVSRPTADLPAPLLAAAAIESLAENLGDAVVAPWLYYAGFGLPGAAAYRVVNTADSMYGYRGGTEWLGKVAARSDDVLSWLPSRLAAATIVGAARLRQGPTAAASARAAWRHDAASTESPNAGRPMAAMAGALQRRLEKRGHYVLGADFPEPCPADVRRAIDLTAMAAVLAAVGLAAALVVARR
jgi:adenosylcobinamide-phosphate synthase